MIFTIAEARDILRIDGTDNDTLILPLVEAIPPYLYESTGYQPKEGEDFSPIAKVVGRFLLHQWYYGEESDVQKVDRVLHSLLMRLSAES